jgi:hypothetical protein
MAPTSFSQRENGESDEIAEAFLYLAPDESSYVLGSELLIDGRMRIK